LPENLKIIIINNGGGGIFELLPGPAKTNAFDYFKTPHQTAIDKICQAFQVDYFKAGSIESFRAVFENFENSGCCSVLELQTLHVDNASIYKQYFSYLRSI
jgi:2-succinyl-5-enolpyruvyl-6-hydroxy-3-cyclohexene-1-carboxylate synthase